MNRQKYLSNLKDAVNSSSMTGLYLLLSMLSNVVLAFFVMTADTSEKTIITPATIDKKFSIHGNHLDADYIELMTRFFSQLLLTYHKGNVDNQFGVVLQYVSPASYPQVKIKFKNDIERIKRNEITSVFHPMGIHIKGNSAVITGELENHVGGKSVNKKQKSYQFNFDYKGIISLIGYHEVLKDSVNGYRPIVDETEIMINEQGMDIQNSLNDKDSINGE